MAVTMAPVWPSGVICGAAPAAKYMHTAAKITTGTQERILIFCMLFHFCDGRRRQSRFP